MDSNYVDDLIDDDEVPELTEEFSRNAISFKELPADLQHILSEINRGNVTFRPDAPSIEEEVTLKLSRPVLERFRASGVGWEGRVDEALRQWMEEHQAS